MRNENIGAITLQQYQEWFTGNYASLQHKSPYHHPAWLDAVARGIHFETVYAGKQLNGELHTVIPAFLTKRGPFNLFGSPLRGTLSSILGPVSLFPFEKTTEVLNFFGEIKEFARKQWGIHYCRFSILDTPDESMPAIDTDWEVQRPGSYWLDLSGGREAVWNGLKSDCRRNIRKAQKLGIEVIPLTDPEFYYQLLEKTYQRHGSSSWHSKKFFQILLEELVPKGILWAWGAKYQDEIIAACLFFHNDREVHFISGASNPQFGNLPTSYLLHWQAIETAIGEGLTVYYTDGSGVRSIDQFKESFNPVRKERFTLVWSPKHVKLAQNVFIFSHSSVRKLKSITKTIPDKIAEKN